MSFTVECQKRPEGSKPNALRRNGQIPANLYGHKDNESIALVIDAKVAERLLKKVSVNNTLVDLNVTDIPWQGKTLLREVQSHPARNVLYHLSFFAVAGHGDTDVEVPLHFVGEAVGVKQEGGHLDPVVTHLPIRCAPDKIPQMIEIDVSNLNMGESLHIGQITLPEGVTFLGEQDQTIVTILPPRVRAETTEESAS